MDAGMNGGFSHLPPSNYTTQSQPVQQEIEGSDSVPMDPVDSAPTHSGPSSSSGLNQLQLEDNYRQLSVQQSATPMTQLNQTSGIQQLAPGLDLASVIKGDVKRSEEGATGVYFISKNDCDLVVKTPDETGFTLLDVYLSTQILDHLGISVPKTFRVSDPNEIAELKRITQKGGSYFLVMEKIGGVIFLELLPHHQENLLSKNKPFFNELGRLFLFDHFLSTRSDRMSSFKVNPSNLMLTDDHIVAIDNNTDFLKDGGKGVDHLEEFNHDGFVNTKFLTFFERVKMQCQFELPTNDNYYSNQFFKGLLEGMDLLIEKFAEQTEEGLRPSREKIASFLKTSGCPEQFQEKAITSMTSRMQKIIELNNSDRYNQARNSLRSNTKSTCCVIL